MPADNLTKQQRRARAALEAEMEVEIDSLLATRRRVRESCGDIGGVHTLGQGRRTLHARQTYRASMPWSRPVKARNGALD